MLTTVTGKNQVTIPSKLASLMQIEPGMQLEWQPGQEPGELRVKVMPSRAALARSLRGAGRRFVPPSTDVVGGLVEERTREAGEEGAAS
jgi:bifunctional DNA-binding transcriptional regulator/antitoxin component of YhaV-PrlF toxin-antitoxin module